ncbi:hypothetical protein [Pigmentiphaga litoralis]|jgi:hypothetical protein|uniref:hypothetical protein n=1 Tax=Pigmentiphaga litoralis TaxID=516702 RepID=UPI0016773D88|nr:hypothetical protein [Pigmentiphaga litoralis]
MAVALLVLVMQTAGLAHRIQHGDAAIPGLAAALAMGAGQAGAANPDAIGGREAFTPASTPASPALPDGPLASHFGHSCVLFDGDSLFVGGTCLPPSLTPLRVTQLAPRSFAALPVDLAPLRAFRSRAPPRGEIVVLV